MAVSKSFESFFTTREAGTATLNEDVGTGLEPAPTSSIIPIIPGNIDLHNRPIVKNTDGTYSTVRSISFEDQGKEVLVPTVSDDGRIMSDREAINQYLSTGKHLGIFNSADDADKYAQNLHEEQATEYGPKAKPTKPASAVSPEFESFFTKRASVSTPHEVTPEPSTEEEDKPISLVSGLSSAGVSGLGGMTNLFYSMPAGVAGAFLIPANALNKGINAIVGKKIFDDNMQVPGALTDNYFVKTSKDVMEQQAERAALRFKPDDNAIKIVSERRIGDLAEYAGQKVLENLPTSVGFGAMVMAGIPNVTSLTMMGVSTAGAKEVENAPKVKSGEISQLQSSIDAGINGIAEGVGEAGGELKVFEGLKNVFKGLSKTVGEEKARETVFKTVQRVVGGFLKGAKQEVPAEVATQLAQDYTDKVTGVSPDLTWEQMVSNAADAALAAGGTGGPIGALTGGLQSAKIRAQQNMARTAGEKQGALGAATTSVPPVESAAVSDEFKNSLSSAAAPEAPAPIQPDQKTSITIPPTGPQGVVIGKDMAAPAAPASVPEQGKTEITPPKPVENPPAAPKGVRNAEELSKWQEAQKAREAETLKSVGIKLDDFYRMPADEQQKVYNQLTDDEQEQVLQFEPVAATTIDQIRKNVNEAERTPEEKQEIESVNTEPSEAQKSAGNYRKAHIQKGPFNISVENPAGSERAGVDRSGKEWRQEINHDYGYIRGTKGADAWRSKGKKDDQLDVFIKPGSEVMDKPVYIVNQVDPQSGKFDEHKVMMGFDSEAEARLAYLSNYEQDWQGLGSMYEMPMERFTTWAYSDATKLPYRPDLEKQQEAEDIEPTSDEMARSKKMVEDIPGLKFSGVKGGMRRGETVETENKIWFTDDVTDSTLAAPLGVTPEELRKRVEESRKKFTDAQKGAEYAEKGRKKTLLKKPAGEKKQPDDESTIPAEAVQAVSAPAGIVSNEEKQISGNAEDLPVIQTRETPPEPAAEKPKPDKAALGSIIASSLIRHDDKYYKKERPEETAEQRKKRVDSRKANGEKMAGELIDDIENKNLDKLINRLSVLDNKGSRAAFVAYTGQKLPGTVQGTVDFLREFVGKDVAEARDKRIAEARESKERKDTEEKRAQRDDRLKNVKVKYKVPDSKNEMLTNRYEMIRDVIRIHGYTELKEAKKGAVKVWELHNPKTERFYTFRQRDDADLARETIDELNEENKAKENKVIEIERGPDEINKKSDNGAISEEKRVASSAEESGVSNQPPPEKLSVKERARRKFEEKQAARKAKEPTAAEKIAIEKEKQAVALGRAADALKRLGKSFGERDPNTLYSIGTEQGEIAFEAVSALVEAGYREFKVMAIKIQELAKEFIGIKGFRDAIEDAYDAYAEEDTTVEKRKESIDEVLKKETPDDILKKEEVTNHELERNGAEQLAGKPPENVQPAGSERTAGTGAGERGVRRGREGGKTGRGRDESHRRIGDGTEGGTTPATGKRSARTRGEKRPAPGGTVNGGRTDDKLNYHITDADELGKGGLKQKYSDNVAALKTLLKIESENRKATPDEQRVLVRYVGWGAMPKVFDEKNPGTWEAEAKELRALLSDEDYAAARTSTVNAHYTASDVVRGMWSALRRMGFVGGKVFEPGCGIGHFFGMKPQDINCMYTGVEMDPLTARIAQQLYQTSSIVAKPFEQYPVAEYVYDVAIGNVPFSDKIFPYDKEAKRYGMEASKYRLHDFFFLKALYGVKPGGVLAFITSRGTMDKKDSTVRRKIAQQADFIGAIRLPGSAFKENAGTDVVTDIVFLKKRAPGTPSSDLTKEFIESDSVEFDRVKGEGKKSENVNRYFVGNPRMVLGRQDLSGTMYGPDQYNVVFTGSSIAEELAKAVELLPSDIIDTKRREAAAMQDITAKALAPDSIPIGGFYLEKGKIFQKIGEKEGVDANLKGQTFERVKGMIYVKQAIRRLLTAQYESDDDANLVTHFKSLNAAYDGFVDKYGYLHQRANVAAMEDDPDGALLLALENWDRDAKKATKADIFSKRTIRKSTAIESAGTPLEAMLISLSEKGGIDWNYMARLTGTGIDDLRADLIKQGQVFVDPAAFLRGDEDVYIVREEYLSGNVREKLKRAQEAAKKQHSFDRNVQELEKILPADLDATQVYVRLNSPILQEDDITQFMADTFDVNEASISLKHSRDVGKYYLDFRGRYNPKVTATYGTDRADAIWIVDKLLNSKQIEIWDTLPDKSRRINTEATDQAKAKADEIVAAFNDWIWKNADRTTRILRDYNDNYNSIVDRTFTHPLRAINPDAAVTYPGCTYTLRPHQADVIWRQVQNKNVMLAHTVGAGKTLEMICGGMELKRLGLRQKPMYVVPNHLVEQWAISFRQAYPGARVLVATDKNFKPGQRKEFLNRIATGNWDAVIVKQSHFLRIPVSPEFEKAYIDEKLSVYRAALEEAKANKGTNRTQVKDLEARVENYENRIKRLTDSPKDTGVIPFDMLGVDQLFVDEFDMYKNLDFFTQRRVLGLGTQSGAEKSTDLAMKVKLMADIGGGVVGGTGTPISNSMAETYHMMRYLQPEVLRSLRIENFDEWANMFAQEVTSWELNNSGSGYKLRTRFSKFVNIPELMRFLRQTWDIQTADMLERAGILAKGKNLPLVQYKTISAPATPVLKSFIGHLKEMEGNAKKIPGGVLKIIGLGRQAAVDMRLIAPSLPDDPEYKLNMAAAKAVELLDRYPGRTGLIFYDLTRPDPGRPFNPHGELRKKMVDAGIPNDEIAFIHDFDTDARKLALFDAVNAGRIRVVIGSTEKMGAGTNVQRLLKWMIHIDAPWRPRDIEQREGRIVRQGNTNEEVEIYRFVSKGSYDIALWNLLDIKARVIRQVMAGDDTTTREIEDDSSFSNVMLMAVDNPLVKESMELDQEIKRLTAVRKNWQKQTIEARDKLQRNPVLAQQLREKAAAARADLKKAGPKPADFSIVLHGKKYAERNPAGEVIIRDAKDNFFGGMQRRQSDVIGNFAGMALYLEPSVNRFSGTDEFELVLQGNDQVYRANGSMTAHINGVHLTQIVWDSVDGLEGRAKSFEARAAKLESELDEYRSIAEKPFGQDQKLEDSKKRLAEILEQLRKDEEARGKEGAAETGKEYDWEALEADRKRKVDSGEEDEDTPENTTTEVTKPAVPLKRGQEYELAEPDNYYVRQGMKDASNKFKGAADGSYFEKVEKWKKVDLSLSGDWFASKNKDGKWVLSDGRTGLRMTNPAKTLAEMVSIANDMMTNLRHDKINEAIEKNIYGETSNGSGGLSPRYRVKGEAEEGEVRFARGDDNRITAARGSEPSGKSGQLPPATYANATEELITELVFKDSGKVPTPGIVKMVDKNDLSPKNKLQQKFIESEYKKDVVWFEADPAILAPLTGNTTDGFVVIDTHNPVFKNKIFINTKAIRPTLWVASHELSHFFETNPEYNGRFWAAAKLTDAGRAEMAKHGKSEFAADIIGEMMARKDFWENLQKQGRGPFETILKKMVAILSKIRAAMRKVFAGAGFEDGSRARYDEYIANVEELRSAVAGIYTDYRNSQEKLEGSAPERMAAAMGNKQNEWNETKTIIDNLRKENPISLFENELKTDSDRGYARYIDKYFSELPEELQRWWLTRPSYLDQETGERITVENDGVRGTHVYGARMINDPFLDETISFARSRGIRLPLIPRDLPEPQPGQVEEARAEAEIDQERVDALQKEMNQLRYKLRSTKTDEGSFNAGILPEERLRERAEISLKIRTAKATQLWEIKNAIYDYAKAIGLSGVPYNKVDLLMKNAETPGALKKAMERLDDIWLRYQRSATMEKVLQLVDTTYRRLKSIEAGKLRSTVAPEWNVRLKQYLDSLSSQPDWFEGTNYADLVSKMLNYYNMYAKKDIARAENVSDLPADIVDWMQDPTKPVPDNLRKMIRELFRSNLTTMTTDQLSQVAADIDSIYTMGKTVLEAREAARKDALDKMAAEESAKIRAATKEHEGDPLDEALGRKRMMRMEWLRKLGEKGAWSFIDPERMVEWLTGWTGFKGLKEAVLMPLYRSEDVKSKNMKLANEHFIKNHEKVDWRRALNQKLTDIDMEKLYAVAEVDMADVPENFRKTMKKSITIDNAMFIYANTKNPGNLAHLRGLFFSDKVADAFIASAVSALPKEYIEAVDRQIEYYDNIQWDRVNRVFERDMMVQMPKEAGYFPIQNLKTDRAESAVVADYMARFSSRVAGVQKGVTRSRVHSKAPFRKMSYFGTVTSNMMQVEHYIAYNDAVREVSRFLNHAEVRAAMQAKSEEVYGQLREWVKAVAYGRVSGSEHVFEKFFDFLRKNFATYALGLKVTTALMQLTSLPKGMAMIDKVQVARSVMAFMMHPRAAEANADSKSTMMANRTKGYERELSEMFEASAAREYAGISSLNDKAKKALMWHIGRIDKIISTILWNAKYDEAMHAGMSKQSAAEAADEMIRKTQSRGGVLYMPSIYRGNGLARAFTIFTSDLNQNINMLFELQGKWKIQSSTKNIHDVFWMFAIPTTMIWMIDNAFIPIVSSVKNFIDPDEPEDFRMEEWMKQFVTQFTGGIAFLGPILDAIVGMGADTVKDARGLIPDKRWTTYLGDMTPAGADFIEKIVQGVANRKPEALFESIAIAAGYPYRTLKRYATGAVKVAKEGPEAIPNMIWSDRQLREESIFNSMARRLYRPRPKSDDLEKYIEWYGQADRMERRAFERYAQKWYRENLNAE